MTIRSNHYEAAFEAYLRHLQTPYVAVDESRRSIAADGTIKNVDFIVSPSGSEMSWLVDVKGRQFPSGRKNRYWKNWATIDDLQSMAQWELLFGPQFRGLFVFAYCVTGDMAPLPQNLLFPFRGEVYAFVGVRIDLYAAWARRISPKWRTIAMPTTAFRQLAQPLKLFLETQVVSGGDFDRRRATEMAPMF